MRQFCLIEGRQARISERLPTMAVVRTSQPVASSSAEDLKALAEVRKTWLELANQGHAIAYGALALLYEQGRGGVERDEREAARLYSEGAALGDR